MAGVWSILALCPYLYGTTFILRTEYEAPKWVLDLADSSGRLARWRLRLAEYDYDIHYRLGVKHHLTDGVSRLRTEDGETAAIENEVSCFVVEVSGQEPEARPIDI